LADFDEVAEVFGGVGGVADVVEFVEDFGVGD